MTITSDITLDASRFIQENITEDTKKTNSIIETVSSKGPRWHEVGAAKYRAMRETGETPLPVPVYLPGAKDATVPSRDPGRIIPVRVYTPDNGLPSKGIFLHIHGGGFVLSTHQHQDGTLQRYANTCQLTAISIGYRLAPEDPWPAAVHDCFDVAEHLVDNGQSAFGASLLLVSGESAGACLSVLTAFHLLRVRPDHRLAGVIFPFGQFDLTLNLPKVSSFERALVINRMALQRFSDAYTPDMSIEERRNHLVSPLYDDIERLSSVQGSLPPALFLCGTEDPLLDDTILMSTKWMMTGSEAIVKIYPGVPHAFTTFPGFKPGQEAIAIALQFAKEKLEALSANQPTK
ncbi:alpha/beta hydrolase fold-3 domain-containing protein [Mariannaea sp. PMI_226]|nr:alpha/beta hydrolase fold-3 domain-containing protein [Mariannaea sp. PMI_226]